MADTVWASGFWATDFWAADFWAGGVVPPVVVEPSGGGRRIKKREYRPLNKRERDDLDRLFQRNAKPRYVAPPEPVSVTKRTGPIVITLPPDAPRPITRDADRIHAARQFLALDAIEALLDALPTPAIAARQAHLLAQQHAQRLADEQERMAMAYAAARIEAARVVEVQRLADESELMMVLLLVHDGIVA